MKLLKILLLISFFSLGATTANSSNPTEKELDMADSFSYSLIFQIKKSSTETVFNIMKGLSEKAMPLALTILAICFFVMLAIDLIKMQLHAAVIRYVSFMVSCMFFFATFNSLGWQIDNLYKPLVDLTTDVPAFIMNIADGNKLNSDSGLKDLFLQIDKTYRQLRTAGENMASKAGGFGLGVLSLKMKGWVISWIFTVLYVAFIIMFCMSVLASCVMLSTFAITLPLAYFSWSSGLWKNSIRAYFTYSLIPTFITIVMAITAGLLVDLTNDAETINNSVDKNFTESFFMHALCICVFCFFLLLKGGEFASQVLGGSISNMGALAAGVGGIAGGAAKAGSLMAGKKSLAGGMKLLSQLGVFSMNGGMNTLKKLRNKSKNN